MFTKNLKDQFSADLLNTVRGVLGEAKHDKECECEKCEKEEEDDENEDEMKKEGYVSHAQRKAVWASRADDGEGHPDKKKKVKKEGYMPAADEPSDKDKKVAQKIRDMMAKEKKPVKEDAEELDEISKATMGRYINKAKDSIDTASYRQGHREALGGSSKPLEKKLTKRHKGIETAVKKLTKEESEQIDELSKKTLGSYVKMAAHQAASKGTAGGMTLGRSNNSDDEAAGIKSINKAYKRTQGISKAVDKLTKEESEQIDELSKATMGRYINKAATKMGSQGVTAGLKIAADEKSSKNFKDMGKREKGIKLAVNKLTKEEQDFIDSLNDADVEQIDELSGATLGSYMVKSKKDETARKEHGIKVRDEIRKQTGLNVGTPIDRKLYSPTASRGAGQKTAMKKLTGQARVNAKEEFELEEGRGRPPKEGSAAWKARQGKADDDMVALGMQLRKAHSINKKVRFMDGKEHDIHPNHITRFNDHMGARRTTQEKDNFQRQAHKSHADFVKAVSAPVPKAAKDTGEIVKYR